MKINLQLFGGRGASSSQAKSGSKTTNRWKGEDFEFRSQMLGRLVSDVKYFLGNGNGNEKDLWAKGVKEHIKEMKDLYSTFTDKQKSQLSTTEEDINKYARQMRKIEEQKSKGSSSYNPQTASEVLEMKKGGMNYATTVNYYKASYGTTLKEAENNVKKYWNLKTAKVGNRNFFVVDKVPRGFTKEDETSKYTIYSDKNNNRVLKRK